MEMEKYQHGVPSWVDIGVPNADKSAAFYSSLFGWDCPPGAEEFGGYRLCTLRGLPVAGMGPQQNPGPTFWTPYVNVDSVDETTTKVTANGGQAMMPAMDVMDLGRMAIFADPVGAAFGVWQAGTFPGAAIVNEPGAFSWAELITSDVETSKAFYGAVLGWDAQTHGEGPGAYIEWQVDGTSIGGMMAKPPDMPAEVPPYWGVYFSVIDTDATVDRVKSLGGALYMGPADIEPGRFAVVADPDGAVFNVITLNPDQPAT